MDEMNGRSRRMMVKYYFGGKTSAIAVMQPTESESTYCQQRHDGITKPTPSDNKQENCHCSIGKKHGEEGRIHFQT